MSPKNYTIELDKNSISLTEVGSTEPFISVNFDQMRASSQDASTTVFVGSDKHLSAEQRFLLRNALCVAVSEQFTHNSSAKVVSTPINKPSYTVSVRITSSNRLVVVAYALGLDNEKQRSSHKAVPDPSDSLDETEGVMS